MTNLEFVFWGFTLEQLLLAAGRYTLMVSAALLAIKHAAWFSRLRYRRERRRKKLVRSVIELVASAAMAALYAQSIYSDGPAARFVTTESLIQVWLLAILFIGLVLGRSDSLPPD